MPRAIRNTDTDTGRNICSSHPPRNSFTGFYVPLSELQKRLTATEYCSHSSHLKRQSRQSCEIMRKATEP